VRYNATSWLEKNKDPLNDSAVAILKTTQDNQLISDIWKSYMTQEDILEALKAGGEFQFNLFLVVLS